MTKKRIHIIPAEWLEKQLEYLSTNEKWHCEKIKEQFPAVEVPDHEDIDKESRVYANSLHPITDNQKEIARLDCRHGMKVILDKLLKG